MPDKILQEDTDSFHSQLSDIIFEHQESEVPHNPYDLELREQLSIETGDTGMLGECLAEGYHGREGRMAREPVRQEKNIAIAVSTLASRSAIRGGMLPEEAFSMVDAFVLEIEDMEDPVRIRAALHRIEYEFAEQVHEINAGKDSEIENTEKQTGDGENVFVRNEMVERTKNYIFQNLHSSIVIGDLGKQVGANPSYLSSLFKKNVGITISQYIRKQKIRLAQNMLRYSDYEIRDIASYLSFCSQSHFGNAFRLETGMSPAKYREKWKGLA